MANINMVKKQPRSLAAPGMLNILFGTFLALFLFAVLAVVLLFGYRSAYSGRIFPGVYVAGIPLGGLTLDEAEAKLISSITYPDKGRLVLKYEDESWLFSPAQLGVFLDSKGSTLAAFEAGRLGDPLESLRTQFELRRSPRNLAPKLIFDQRKAFTELENLAQQVNKPIHEPEITLTGTQVNILEGAAGQSLEIHQAIQAVADQTAKLEDGVISLQVKVEQPAMGSVEEQAAIARNILSAPFTIQMPPDQTDGKGPWTINQDQLATMLAFEKLPVDGKLRYQVTLKTNLLRDYLRNLQSPINADPENPRFIFNDETGQLDLLKNAVIGRSMNMDESLRTVQEKLINGEHQAELVLNITKPPVMDASTGEELGIRELVHAETSYFYGSSADRVQNISTSAAQYHGLLVAPGEVFSMAAALGDVSLENGYAEALIIYGDQTIQGVGGGVCQVSTTLFRAAFFTGYPIPVRHAHAYRVSYYEMVAGGRINQNFAGLDATVYAPVVDMKFTNDTPYWLLMETYVNPSASSITWKFYSTKDGRTVDWNTTGLQNITTPPPPSYKLNAELPTGTVKQVDWAVDGGDVTVWRTVNKDGSVYFQDQFSTHFQAWQAKYQYGPDTPDMPPAEAN